jgi:pimeloyl-ACP methyl ester carboxylesterase
VAKTFYDPSHVTEELLDDVIDIINDRDKAVRLIRFARSVEKRSIRDDLGSIQAPTLLVWGKQDEITPPDVARMFHEGISGSELHFVDKCGHVPMQEQPDVFNRLMIEFLDRIAHTPSPAKAS